MQKSRLQSIENQLKKLTHKVNCTTQFHDSLEDFPEVGSLCALYVDKSTGAVYVYDEDTQTYITADPGGDAEFSLTTTGTSGPATLLGTVLNIPQYQAALTNPVTGTGTSGQVSYWNGTTTQTGSQDFTWNDTTKILSFSSGGTLINEIRVGSINTNTIIGRLAGSSASLSGGSNSFFGQNSGSANTTGSNNSFFGATSGQNNTTGVQNSFFGFRSGLSNTSGSANVVVGFASAQFQTTGSNNVFFGRDAGRLIADGSNLTVASNSVFLGYDTRAAANNETNQTVIGYSAVGLGSNTTVIGNSSTTLTWLGGSTSIGTTTSSGRLTVQGSGTTSSTKAFVVNNATPTAIFEILDNGRINQTIPGGSTNTLFGTDAGANASLANNNHTAFGRQALFSTTTAANCTAIGREAAYNGDIGDTTAVGYRALYANISGFGNTAIGTAALASVTSGNNVGVGRNAGSSLTASTNNLILGYNAGRFIIDGVTALTVANNSVFLGFDTRAAANSQTNQTVIGYQAIGLGSNTTVIGNSSTTQTHLYGSLTLGDTTLNASAVLDVSSTTKGFLPPRMTTAERNLIATPAAGLVIFNTSTTKLECFDGAVWQAAW